MNIDKTFTRRIRIEGKPDEVHGYMMEVRDGETGELITNVKSAILSLSVTELNKVQLTYYPEDELSHKYKREEEQIVLDHPEIAVTALDDAD